MRYVLLFILCSTLFPVIVPAQGLLRADTLTVECETVRMKTGQTVVRTQQEYDRLIFSDDVKCLPFREVDFTKHILVGYVYTGSNCDKLAEASTAEVQDNRLVLRFILSPAVCRDMHKRLIWFMIDKPDERLEVVVERVPG